MRPTNVYFSAVLIVTIGASFQFYSYAVMNPMQEMFTQWVNATYSSRGWHVSGAQLQALFSVITGSFCVGAIAGCLLLQPMANRVKVGCRYGRRSGLQLNACVNVLAGVCMALARPTALPELLILGRILYGFCMGVASGWPQSLGKRLVPMYLTEISPNHIRGAAGTAHQMSGSFSEWFSMLIGLPVVLGSETLWPYALMLPALPAFAMLILLPYLPESPRYLMITKGDHGAAYASSCALHGVHSDAFLYNIRDEMLSVHTDDQGHCAGMRELFGCRPLRRPLTICAVVMLAQQFTGACIVFAYSTDILLGAGVLLNMAQYASVAIGVCYFVFVLPSAYLIERCGRRAVSLFQLCMCWVCVLVLSVSIYLSQTYTWAPKLSVVCLIVYMAAYGVGSPIPWIITTEIFTQQYRAAAVTLSTLLSWTTAWVLSSVYMSLKQLLTTAGSFVPFLVLNAICIVYLYRNLPETKNRAVEEIMNEYMCINAETQRKPRRPTRGYQPIFT